MLIEPIKSKVRDKFNQAASTYDLNCSVQNSVCLKAIQLLLKHQNVFDYIADFGCGTGESTNSLLKHLECKRCYAADFARKLLMVARNKLSYIDKIEWIHCDFEEPIKLANALDLIFCNMGLQWSTDMINTLCLWRSYLKQQGFLLFSVPMAENFPELKEDIKPKFLTDKEITGIVASIGMNLVAKNFESFKASFTNQLQALKALKATGTNYNKTNIRPNQGLNTFKPDNFFKDPNVSELTYEIGTYLIRNDG